MTRQEIKSRARQQLGGKIFGITWLMAVLVVVIAGAAESISSVVVVGPIILMGPMSFALSKMFLKQARDGQQMNVADMVEGFTGDFVGNFLLGLLESLFIFLWSLLFVIPGIVKMYAYSQAFYIKADHPEKTWKQCLDESQAMMKGKKMTLFIQDLSFIGWIIVSMFTFGIGMLWVAPYMEAARAQFYESIKPADEAAA